MKKNVRKIICIVLVISLAVLALAMLSSCNKKDNLDRDTQKETQTRTEVCDKLLNNMMKFAGDGWTATLTDAEIVALTKKGEKDNSVESTAGAYVSNLYWFTYFVGILKTSEIRTVKLETMNTFLEGEIQRREEEDEDEKEAVSAMKFVLNFISGSGLLSEESASISYLAVVSVLDQAQKIYSDAIEKCNSLLNPGRTDITLKDLARKSLQSEVADMERSREYLQTRMTAEVKEVLLKSLSESKQGFESMFKIVYEFGGLLSTGQMKDVIDGGKGAMSNLSKNDIINFLESIKIKLKTMNDYFVNNEEEVIKIKNTFDQVSSLTNTFVARNQIVYGALNMVRYVNTGMDIIPIITDVILKSWSVLENDETFIDDVITRFLKAEDPQEENLYILMARALIEYKKNAGETIDASKAYSKEFINVIDENISGDVYASVVYILLELYMDTNNEGKYFDIDTEGKTEEEIEDAKQKKLSILSNPIWALVGMYSLRKTYEQFLTLDTVQREDVIYSVNGLVSTLTAFGVLPEEFEDIATMPEEGNTDGWYTDVYLLLEAIIVMDLVPQALEITDNNMMKYIDEIYVQGALEDIASSEWVERADTQEYKDPNREALNKKVDNASLIKLFLMLPVFAQMFKV